MTLRELHYSLTAAVEHLLRLHGRLPADISGDSALAIGHATGTLSRAMAMVQRDIDNGSHPGQPGAGEDAPL